MKIFYSLINISNSFEMLKSENVTRFWFKLKILQILKTFIYILFLTFLFSEVISEFLRLGERLEKQKERKKSYAILTNPYSVPHVS